MQLGEFLKVVAANTSDSLRARKEVDFDTFRKIAVFLRLDLDAVCLKLSAAQADPLAVPNCFLLRLLWAHARQAYLAVCVQKHRQEQRLQRRRPRSPRHQEH